MKPVTDPSLLAALDAAPTTPSTGAPGLKAVTDPALLSQLETKPIAAAVQEHWTDNLRDPLAGVLKIGPTAVKGVADIARLLTNDAVGADTSNYLQKGMRAIDDVVGSDRLRAQQDAISNILQSDDFSLKDIPGMVASNPRAALDAGISTIGSMFLPAGVAAGAVRGAGAVANAGKIGAAVSKIAPTTLATGTAVGTGALMNAGETFSDSEGGDTADRYQGAALSGATSAVLGKLLGGGAEGLIARRLAGEIGKDTVKEVAKSVAKSAVKEGAQEFGEEGTNTIGKQIGKGEDINLNAAAKSGAYGAAIGSALGASTDLSTNARALKNAPAAAPEIDPNAPAVDEPAAKAQPLSERLETLASRMEAQGKTDEAREYRVQAQEAKQIEADPEAQRRLMQEAMQDGDAASAVADASQATGLKPQEGPVLQNRDRSTASSITQMQSIAADPDYGRLGYSRDFANGAPVVAGGNVDAQHLGRTDMAVASDGRRIPVQYAVVEADSVTPSNTVDGTPNQAYASSQGMRAIAGNGRIAGLQAAAQRGTNTKYKGELSSDTLHGVDPQVIAGMRAPVLVRVMPQDQVTDNIGDLSNTSGNLSLSAVEQAANDGQRVDLSGLEFAEDGAVTPQAVRQFVQGMPQAEIGQLLDTNGQPTKQAVDRLNAAVFSRAYGNDQLVRLYAQAQDPEARLILSALAKIAPKMARLEGAGALDIRPIVSQAAEIAVNARRNGTPLAQAAAQMDMASDPLVGQVLQLFAANPRSNKQVIEQLGNAADMAYSEANKEGSDMFGEVPRASREQVINQLGQDNEQPSAQTVEQPAGASPVQPNADGQPTAAPAPADRAAAQTSGTTQERASPSTSEDAGLTSYTPEEVTARQDAQAKAQQDQARADRQADERAKADRDRDEFALTGSDRAADANANQGNMFSQQERASTGNTQAAVRDALSARFGSVIGAMENRGFLKLWDSYAQFLEQNQGAQGKFSQSAPKESEAFKRWFGKSAVLNEDGEPLVMYHGTYNDFTQFDRMASRRARQASLDTIGSWFSDNPSADGGAGMYGRTVMPVYLKAEKIRYYDSFDELTRDMVEANGQEYIPGKSNGIGSPEALRERLIAQGYDAIGLTRTDNAQIQEEIAEAIAAVRRAKDDEFSVPRSERAPYTMKRERLEATVVSLRADAEAMGAESLEFDKQNVVIVFNPNQIKSATGNSGDFDPSNPDIRYSQSEGVQGMYDGKAVHLFADGIARGDEIGVFLHEAGEHASMEDMLGNQYADLVKRANDLVREGDADALAAQARIPADTNEAARDSELVAYMVETVANKKPLSLSAKARRWLADVVAGVRAWFYTTSMNKTLAKYGKGINLTPQDIAALAERAVNWQSNVNGTSADASDAATQFAKKKEAAPNPENLIVAHNLTAANILAAQELGGLAVPSLAITKADAPIEGFGEVTLVGDTALATPGAKNPIFDADVYSPRFPSVQVKVNERLVRKALEPLQDVAQSLGVRARGLDAAIDEMARGRLEDAVSRVTYDTGMRLAYAQEVMGKQIALPRVAPKPVAKAGAPLLEQSPLKEFLVGKTQQDIKNLPPVQSQELAQKIYVALFNKMMAEDMASDQPRGLDETIKLVNRRIGIWADHKIESGSTDINDELVGVLTAKGEMALRNLMANASAPAQPESGAALDAPVDVVALGSLLDKQVPREQMDAWVREKLAPAMGDKKVVKESGRTADYTMDNVVREMARKVRDAEGFNYGLGNARSKGATKFKNLEHIQSRRDQVVPKAEFQKAREALDSEFTELVDAVEPYKTYERESTLELLAEAIGNSYGKPLGRALADAGLDGVPTDLQGRITTFAEKLRSAPTEYFEAKPQRGVNFDEFTGAVVPKGMDPAARKVLEDAGLTLVEYEKGNEGARARAVDSLSKELHDERGNVRFSKSARSTTGGNNNPNALQSSSAPWNVPEPGTLDNWARALQDNKIDLKRIRDTLTQQYGPMMDKHDAYLNEELFHGRVAARVNQIHDEVVKPLLAKIANAGKNAKVTMDDVNLYLHSRHAPERNAAMKEINPDMKNNEALSGMSDQEAATNIARLRADGKLAALQVIAADVDSLIADTRAALVADGLEDAAVVQAWESKYKHYVPLQRDMKTQGSGAGKGMGFSVKGPEAKSAVGSNREVVNILANILASSETAAIRAEKNLVGRSLLAMAQAYPNKDFWTVDTPPTKPRIDKDTGLVIRNAVDPLYQTADNVVMLKDAQGKAHYVVFNEHNERAVMAARAMKNIDVASIPKMIEIVGKGTRFMASMLTAYNPEFWVTNFARDVQGALLNMEGTNAQGLQKKFLGNLKGAFKGMHSLVRGDGTGVMAQYAREMQEAGGTTGYMQQFENSDERMKDLRKEIDRMQQGKADPRRLGRNMLNFIEDYNDIIENAVRLAAYKTARDVGASIPRAASLAKNITVNFNRKGNQSANINSLFMFFNASLQGTVRMMQAITTSKKAQAFVGVVAGLGFVMDMVNRMIAGDDDETGRNRYDMIPEFEKSKNWIFMNPWEPGQYVKIPLPLGPHIFHNAGRLTSDAINRKDPRNASEYAFSFAGMFFDAFSPLGGGETLSQFIAPSVFKPAIQLEQNESFTGAPVYKSADRGFGNVDPRPAYTRHFESTPQVWIAASKALNDITGGDNIKPGWINIEPDIYKHIFYTFTGGPGRSADQTIDMVQGELRGEDVNEARYPFVRRFYGQNDAQQRNRIFYEEQKEVLLARARYEDARKAGRPELAKEIATELGDGDMSKGLTLIRDYKGVARQLQNLNKQIKREMEREREGEDRSQQLNKLRERRNKAMSGTVRRHTETDDDD